MFSKHSLSIKIDRNMKHAIEKSQRGENIQIAWTTKKVIFLCTAKEKFVDFTGFGEMFFLFFFFFHLLSVLAKAIIKYCEIPFLCKSLCRNRKPNLVYWDFLTSQSDVRFWIWATILLGIRHFRRFQMSKMAAYSKIEIFCLPRAKILNF